jgi:hypothetical protein
MDLHGENCGLSLEVAEWYKNFMELVLAAEFPLEISFLKVNS